MTARTLIRHLPLPTLIAGLIVLSAGSREAYAAAVAPALSYSSITGSANLDGYTLGWEFTVTQNTLVTHLGYYDYANNGLAHSHAVGIYDLAQNLLVSDTVLPSDTLAIGAGDNFTYYRYHDIADYWLTPGTYRIGGASNNPDGIDLWHDAPIGLTAASGISLGANGWFSNLSGTVLNFPNMDGTPAPMYGGPNFLFMVPEPASWLLIVGAMAWSLKRPGRKAIV